MLTNAESLLALLDTNNITRTAKEIVDSLSFAGEPLDQCILKLSDGTDLMFEDHDRGVALLVSIHGLTDRDRPSRLGHAVLLVDDATMSRYCISKIQGGIARIVLAVIESKKGLTIGDVQSILDDYGDFGGLSLDAYAICERVFKDGTAMTLRGIGSSLMITIGDESTMVTLAGKNPMNMAETTLACLEPETLLVLNAIEAAKGVRDGKWDGEVKVTFHDGSWIRFDDHYCPVMMRVSTSIERPSHLRIGKALLLGTGWEYGVSEYSDLSRLAIQLITHFNPAGRMYFGGIAEIINDLGPNDPLLTYLGKDQTITFHDGSTLLVNHDDGAATGGGSGGGSGGIVTMTNDAGEVFTFRVRSNSDYAIPNPVPIPRSQAKQVAMDWPGFGEIRPTKYPDGSQIERLPAIDTIDTIFAVTEADGSEVIVVHASNEGVDFREVCSREIYDKAVAEAEAQTAEEEEEDADYIEQRSEASVSATILAVRFDTANRLEANTDAIADMMGGQAITAVDGFSFSREYSDGSILSWRLDGEMLNRRVTPKPVGPRTKADKIIDSMGSTVSREVVDELAKANGAKLIRGGPDCSVYAFDDDSRLVLTADSEKGITVQAGVLCDEPEELEEPKLPSYSGSQAYTAAMFWMPEAFIKGKEIGRGRYLYPDGSDLQVMPPDGDETVLLADGHVFCFGTLDGVAYREVMTLEKWQSQRDPLMAAVEAAEAEPQKVESPERVEWWEAEKASNALTVQYQTAKFFGIDVCQLWRIVKGEPITPRPGYTWSRKFPDGSTLDWSIGGGSISQRHTGPSSSTDEAEQAVAGYTGDMTPKDIDTWILSQGGLLLSGDDESKWYHFSDGSRALLTIQGSLTSLSSVAGFAVTAETDGPAEVTVAGVAGASGVTVGPTLSFVNATATVTPETPPQLEVERQAKALVCLENTRWGQVTVPLKQYIGSLGGEYDLPSRVYRFDDGSTLRVSVFNGCEILSAAVGYDGNVVAFQTAVRVRWAFVMTATTVGIQLQSQGGEPINGRYVFVDGSTILPILSGRRLRLFISGRGDVNLGSVTFLHRDA